MSTEIEQAVMKNFTKALSGSVKTGTAKIDEAIAVSTKFNSLQDVIKNMVSDCAKANSGDGGSAEKFMRDYCGITNQNVPSTNFPLTYVDPATGNITEETLYSGWGVYLYDGKTYQDILPQEGAAVYPTDTTFNANGLTVTVPAESSLNDQEKLAVKGAYSWWLGDAVNLVEETYNVDLNGKSIEFGFDSSGDAGAITKFYDDNGKRRDKPKVDVYTKSSNWNFTDLAEDKLKVYGPYNIASVLAHEMTHVAQFYFNMPEYISEGTPAYIDEGMGELTVGRFDVNKVNALAGNADSLKTALDTPGEITFKISDSLEYKSLEYPAGFLFWHYLMKQTADSADAASTDYNKDYSKLSFNGTEGADVGYAGYVNFGDGSNYALGSGDDKLYIYGDKVSVDGGADNDYISNFAAEVTITGGTGNDSIYNNESTNTKVLINGGADNDYISNFAAEVTITGGTGDDTVYMGEEKSNVFIYANGDGNDTVYNFHENDQMQISGASHSTIASDADVIVSVGDGQVVLKGANGKSLNIVNSYQSTETTPAAATDTVTSAATETVMKKFLKSLDETTKVGKESWDDAIRACSSYDNLQAAVNDVIKDLRNAESAQAFLVDSCGIILENDDNGAITGSDAGGSTVKTLESVVPESGNVDKSFTGDSFEVNGLTVKIGGYFTQNDNNREYTDKTFADLTDNQKYAWQALHSLWVKPSLDLNAESYGNNFSFTNESSATTKTLWVYFGDWNDGTYALVTPNYNTERPEDATETYGLRLCINNRVVDHLVKDDPNGTFYYDGGTDSKYLDTTIAHEFTHAVMAANIQFNTYNSLPVFIREGIADLTRGIDKIRPELITKLAEDPDLLESYLNNTNSDTNDNDKYPYAAGYILFRYLNKKKSSSPTPEPDPATTETVQPATVETVTTAREYAYTYNSGNMTISDYQSGENIKFNGTYSDWAVDGNDFIVNAAEGSLRVSDARRKMIELYDGNDNFMMHALMQNAGDYFAGTVYDEEGNITNGTYYEKVVVIGAGDGDNTIAAGAGGSELWGNAGVNRLIGGDGEDTFIYNNGEGAGFIEAGTEDTIYFGGTTFDQIRKIKFDADRTLFVFDNFNILNVTGQPENFIIGGQKYRADYNAKQLQEVHTN